jgi:signal transduction histidine kinase
VRELNDIAEGIARLARNLAQSREAQERLGRELARQERLAALGRVVAGVAHEVRNPLASIKLRLDLAASAGPALPAPVEQAVSHASSEITRLDRLVADLLVVAGRTLGPQRRVSLGGLVRERADALAPWAQLRRVAVAVSGDANAQIDPDSIARAFDNLLRNAIEASPPDGRVEVWVVDGDREVKLQVDDRGQGVAGARAAELFEPFFTTKADGTGLGLAISRALARAHGGDVVYQRTDGVTRFELSLPAPGPDLHQAAS